MSSRNDEKEEKAGRINWASWLLTIVAIVGAAIWFSSL
jgi:hypothetical protein